MSDKQTVTIPIVIDAEEFWSNTMGSGWENGYAWVKINYLDGADWDKVGKFKITYLDPEDEDKTHSKVLGLEDLVNAYAKLMSGSPFYHCGAVLDWQDQDACSSDAILQTAVYGETIYG